MIAGREHPVGATMTAPPIVAMQRESAHQQLPLLHTDMVGNRLLPLAYTPVTYWIQIHLRWDGVGIEPEGITA
jgi:hypothetical protein